MATRDKGGFTLVDLAAVLVTGVLFSSVAIPAGQAASKREMRVRSSRNLAIIGQASAMYQGAHAGLLPAYSWKAGIEYQIIGQPVPRTYSDDQEAHAAQNQDLLRRLTGRADLSEPEPNGPGTGAILSSSSRIPDRRFSHLILADWFVWGASFPIFVAPDDVNQERWRRDPLDLSTVPYANGYPPGVDSDPNWVKPGVRQRWAFASSYQWVPAAWQPDQMPCNVPIADTPHLFSAPGGAELGGRSISEVAFPAQKVFVFEEFDWSPSAVNGEIGTGGLWCTYDGARSGKLMFDGSVNTRRAADANPSWNPAHPSIDWTQRYVPLDRFPAWHGDPDRRIDQRFRWTRLGLQGIDYAVPAP